MVRLWGSEKCALFSVPDGIVAMQRLPFVYSERHARDGARGSWFTACAALVA